MTKFQLSTEFQNPHEILTENFNSLSDLINFLISTSDFPESEFQNKTDSEIIKFIRQNLDSETTLIIK